MPSTSRAALGTLAAATVGALVLLGAPLAAHADTAPAVTSVTLGRSAVTVYPIIDGYRDSETVTIGGTTTTGHSIATTGRAVLKRGTHVVKTWSLTSSYTHIWWNGRDAGNVVEGDYTLSVSQKGAGGTTRTASTTLVVNSRWLHARSSTAHYSAARVLGSSYYDYSDQQIGDCWKNELEAYGDYVDGAIYCDAWDHDAQWDGTNTAITLSGGVSIPTAVRAYMAYGHPSVTVGQHAALGANDIYSYVQAGSGISYGRAADGYSSRRLWWSGNPSWLRIQFRLGQYADAGVKDYTVTWHYKVLSYS